MGDVHVVAKSCRHVQAMMDSLLVRTALLLLFAAANVGLAGILLKVNDEASPALLLVPLEAS